MSALILENISKKIKNRQILSNVNLNLEAGNIYGFYGRNGSGKSMLFRVISGLVKVDSGNITVFGEKIGVDVSFPSSLGIVIENVGFWNNYTGFECLKLISEIKNLIGDKEIEETLSMLGLDPHDQRKYSQYSLGMKQKLAIAQALMEKPRLIILDEPTNGLDEQSVKQLREVILQRKNEGALILIASHIREDINVLCDTKFLIENCTCILEEEEKADEKS